MRVIPVFRNLSLATIMLGPLLLTVLVMTVACAGGEIPPANDADELIFSLEKAGLGTPEAHPTNPLESSFFPVPGIAIVLPGRKVLAYEFEDESTTQQQVDLVSSDGSGIGNKYIGWRDTPHFFSRGRLIAIYQGSDEKILDALSRALGPQFAGG